MTKDPIDKDRLDTIALKIIALLDGLSLTEEEYVLDKVLRVTWL